MAGKQREVKDRLGRELNIGDPVIISAMHLSYTTIALYFGTVIKIAPISKNITVLTTGNENEKSTECIIKDSKNICLLDDHLFDKVVELKLKNSNAG